MYFPKTHQLHKLLNRNNVKISYSSLRNFNRAINGHTKNKLNEQQNPSPCNCRDKMSYTLNGSCQHKNVVHSCKVLASEIKQNHRYYIGLTEHKFKDRLNKHNSSFKSESERNTTELSNFIWSKMKEKMSYREISHHFLCKESVE